VRKNSGDFRLTKKYYCRQIIIRKQEEYKRVQSSKSGFYLAQCPADWVRVLEILPLLKEVFFQSKIINIFLSSSKYNFFVTEDKVQIGLKAIAGAFVITICTI
jgi:hypothetical protein